MKIIGRIREQIVLKEFAESAQSEFVAVYGRRRVGKTYLIREFYRDRFSFYATGLANADLKLQLLNFNKELNKFGSVAYPLVKTWFESFNQLRQLVENDSRKRKKIIFLDEMPWMDTHKSGFITALEHFWNGWASSRSDILLIVCGSATSWMINKLINNHGGLHNRVTRRMLIEPFTLGECEAFFKEQKLVMNRHQMAESYMVFGGIPYYLSLMNKGLSLAQNIDYLCFASQAPLKEEFSSLYRSLFKYSDNHIKVVSLLAKKSIGLTRDEIITASKIADGGGLSKTLEELEHCGFIRKYNSFGKKNKLQLYQLVDFYTLFYINFIKDQKYQDEHYWTNFIQSAKHRAWSGYAFEQLCMVHSVQLKNKLGISGILSHVASWRSTGKEKGAQIDLLIDRNDQVINICEMKYSTTPFVIDKAEDENLRNKKDVFIRETKTRKAVHLTLVTTYGLRQNEYSGNVQSLIVLDDLF